MAPGWTTPLVFTHVHKCAGSSLRRMLHRAAAAHLAAERMHVPELTCRDIDNLPMLEERGEPLPRGLLLLADHSPFGRYDARVLAPGSPFRITLLRPPVDRLESFYFFCARAGFLHARWADHASSVAAMPDEDLRAFGEWFLQASAYAWWFDPDHRDPERALANLDLFDVVGHAHRLEAFCARFDERNPWGIRLAAADVLHVNPTERPSRFTLSQRRMLEEEILHEDVAFWRAASERHGL